MENKIENTLNKETNDIIVKLAEERKEKNKDIDWSKYLEGFIFPEHDKNCKKCYGLMRIGYEWNPKTKSRGNAVICPIYLEEVKIAAQIHAIKMKAKEDKEKIELEKNNV